MLRSELAGKVSNRSQARQIEPQDIDRGRWNGLKNSISGRVPFVYISAGKDDVSVLARQRLYRLVTQTYIPPGDNRNLAILVLDIFRLITRFLNFPRLTKSCDNI